MNLHDFYNAAREENKAEQKTLNDKLVTDLTNFVAGFDLRDVKMQVITKIPQADSPIKFAFGILLVKMDQNPKVKKALLACEFGVNVLKLVEKDTVNRIVIRPRIKHFLALDPNFMDRYVEFIQGHLQIMGTHVKVIKK